MRLNPRQDRTVKKLQKALNVYIRAHNRSHELSKEYNKVISQLRKIGVGQVYPSWKRNKSYTKILGYTLSVTRKL